MQRFTSFEFQRNAGKVQDAALSEPVAITHHGRDRLVILSVEEYNRLKQRDRRAYSVEEFPERLLEKLSKTTMDPKFDKLNELMD